MPDGFLEKEYIAIPICSSGHEYLLEIVKNLENYVLLGVWNLI